ncbi:MAG: PocR ligand-binding domain-containing protein [Acidobacteria bacterium]|nr:PocR ligand-binding domain-containing protein [Acidobacteriota bacterium]
MIPSNDVLFSSDLWKPALEKFADATHLTVKLFDAEERVVFGPIHPTPFFQLFDERGYDPGIFAECARRGLAQVAEQANARPAVVVSQYYGLAVIGTSLVLDGKIVGAAVGGYAFVDFSQVSEIQRLAHEAGIKFELLWQVAREQKPVPRRRLIVHGELLQVLGDALLRENYRTRQHEQAVVELEKAARAKDEFLAVVSHELRTPLTPILVWTHMLKSDNDPSQIPRAMEMINRNVKLQLRLIEDLLDLNRTARSKMNLELAEHDVSAVLRSAVENIQGEANNKHIRLDLVGAGEPLRVQADAGRLQQVFANILINAVKFTPEGGAIQVSVADEDGNAVVKFRDNGQGIAPEFLPHVFEMFRQQEDGMRRSHSGLGIGLALVKSLVELHGGDVKVKSEGLGLGTEVTVGCRSFQSLPRSKSPKFQQSRRSFPQHSGVFLSCWWKTLLTLAKQRNSC